MNKIKKDDQYVFMQTVSLELVVQKSKILQKMHLSALYHYTYIFLLMHFNI